MKATLKPLVGLFSGLTVMACLTSCQTTAANMRLEASAARLDSNPVTEYGDRLRGVEIVSVNGEQTARESSVIRCGANQIKARFNWPCGGKQEVDLDFEARRGNRYFVKFRSFPPTEDVWAGNLVAEDWIEMLPQNMDPYVMAVGPGPAIIGWALAERAYRSGLTAEQILFPAPADYTDVFVISKDWGEGVVSRVRAHRDGRIDSTTWSGGGQPSVEVGEGGGQRRGKDRGSNSGIVLDRSLPSTPR